MPALSLSLANSVVMTNILLHLMNKKEQEQKQKDKQEKELKKSQARKKIRIIRR